MSTRSVPKQVSKKHCPRSGYIAISLGYFTWVHHSVIPYFETLNKWEPQPQRLYKTTI